MARKTVKFVDDVVETILEEMEDLLETQLEELSGDEKVEALRALSCRIEEQAEELETNLEEAADAGDEIELDDED